jgi:hypothetical protein
LHHEQIVGTRSLSPIGPEMVNVERTAFAAGSSAGRREVRNSMHALEQRNVTPLWLLRKARSKNRQMKPPLPLSALPDRANLLRFSGLMDDLRNYRACAHR